MKLEIGKYYKYIDRKGEDRGVFKCVKINRNKVSLKQDCLLINCIPSSLVNIRKVSQVFKDYK